MTDLQKIEAAVDALTKKALRHGLCQTKTTREDLDEADTALLTLVAGVCRERDELREALLARAKAILAATDKEPT